MHDDKIPELERAVERMEQLLKEHGISEDEVVREFRARRRAAFQKETKENLEAIPIELPQEP
ncbi:MAG TPA: hypothetical protein VFZ25_20370 [Chloroflexota bacterium]|nr:hypothetical protein [Chloroflexota bacterium]